MKTRFQFRSSSFNTTDERGYFINPGCFGDDVCRWLIKELRSRGFETDDEPRQEDFGWYLTFTVAGAEHLLVIGFQPGDDDAEGRWLGGLERTGALRTLFGRRQRDVLPAAGDAVGSALASSRDIRDLEWVER